MTYGPQSNTQIQQAMQQLELATQQLRQSLAMMTQNPYGYTQGNPYSFPTLQPMPNIVPPDQLYGHPMGGMPTGAHPYGGMISRYLVTNIRRTDDLLDIEYTTNPLFGFGRINNQIHVANLRTTTSTMLPVVNNQVAYLNAVKALAYQHPVRMWKVSESAYVITVQDVGSGLLEIEGETGRFPFKYDYIDLTNTVPKAKETSDGGPTVSTIVHMTPIGNGLFAVHTSHERIISDPAPRVVKEVDRTEMTLHDLSEMLSSDPLTQYQAGSLILNGYRKFSSVWKIADNAMLVTIPSISSYILNTDAVDIDWSEYDVIDLREAKPVQSLALSVLSHSEAVEFLSTPIQSAKWESEEDDADLVLVDVNGDELLLDLPLEGLEGKGIDKTDGRTLKRIAGLVDGGHGRVTVVEQEDHYSLLQFVSANKDEVLLYLVEPVRLQRYINQIEDRSRVSVYPVSM